MATVTANGKIKTGMPGVFCVLGWERPLFYGTAFDLRHGNPDPMEWTDHEVIGTCDTHEEAKTMMRTNNAHVGGRFRQIAYYYNE